MRPTSGGSLQSATSSGPPDLLDDYYRSTEGFIDYLVQVLVNSDDDALPYVGSVAGILPKPHLKACDATCREWLVHHRLIYATPGHASYAIINGVCGETEFVVCTLTPVQTWSWACSGTLLTTTGAGCQATTYVLSGANG